jgi:hypothetical protein
MKNAINTDHHLDFMAAPWDDPLGVGGYMAFIVGTCNGLYSTNKGTLMIISVRNEEPGNGHLEDVFQWFEWSARENGVPLTIVAFMNERFYQHCIEKRGFKPWDAWKEGDGLIKTFDSPCPGAGE